MPGSDRDELAVAHPSDNQANLFNSQMWLFSQTTPAGLEVAARPMLTDTVYDLAIGKIARPAGEAGPPDLVVLHRLPCSRYGSPVEIRRGIEGTTRFETAAFQTLRTESGLSTGLLRHRRNGFQ